MTDGYRNPRTKREMTLNAAHSCDVKIRAKRKPGNLPTLYDDIPKCVQKSWKAKGKNRRQFNVGASNE